MTGKLAEVSTPLAVVLFTIVSGDDVLDEVVDEMRNDVEEVVEELVEDEVEVIDEVGEDEDEDVDVLVAEVNPDVAPLWEDAVVLDCEELVEPFVPIRA